MNKVYIEKNNELWNKAMRDLARCKPQDELAIINYLYDLNQEKSRLLDDTKK